MNLQNLQFSTTIMNLELLSLFLDNFILMEVNLK